VLSAAGENAHLGVMLVAHATDRTFERADGKAATWAVSGGSVDYAAAVAAMEARAAAIAQGAAGEMVWLLEHPPLYTAGVSAKAADLLDPGRFPVFHSGRGGQYTYHGPGQRVAYVMLDLGARRKDTRAFVGALEAWIVEALDSLGVTASVVPGRVGVWAGDEKIAAIGVKLRRWVSFHGVSLNVAPDLEHFAGIVPCGIADAGVTSLGQLGRATELAVVDAALKGAFAHTFGPIVEGPPPL
jgi:lipoyl(octanoyl) transferase